MVWSSNLGYPRLGAKRELKRALERYWKGKLSRQELEDTARQLRARHWQLHRELGLDHIPVGDFSLYDHVLDTAALVGAVPERFGWDGELVDLDTYFAMARGVQEKHAPGHGEAGAGPSAPALEMTKWFDTNYHYLVPELEPGLSFRLASTALFDAVAEAGAQGVHPRPVLLGPVTFLLLSKSKDPSREPLDWLDELLPVYVQVLERLAADGVEWIQLDEPALVLDLEPAARLAFERAYRRLAQAAPSLKLLVATYFGDLGENLETAVSLPVAALHLDLVRAPEQLERALALAPPTLSLSLGLVDGRNVWRTDLDGALPLARRAVAELGADRVLLGPSCSLLHSPVDLDLETELDDELQSWLAFAKQKLEEIAVLAKALEQGEQAVAAELTASRAARQSRARSLRTHDPAVRERSSSVDSAMLERQSPHPQRKPAQRRRLPLPPLPTTTIGSFPQTREVRRARAQLRKGESSREQYEAFIESQIEETIRFQEQIGLDVLVHGEAERNDMVEYFGEQLRGFAFTRHGWVQSYGSRGVKPPIIFGDVSRPEAMTVRWTRYGQSLTDRPVKGMLTGPVTMLRWSFVRDDQPQADTCWQIALALRDEVLDLEAAGIRIIQLDEPALREGLPLRRGLWPGYLEWAVGAFRLASAAVRDDTQIHTHMCYAEFADIIDSIGSLDADVILLEASRSQMELLGTFRDYRYPNDVGPGVYDIHSPRVPDRDEMESLLRKALAVVEPDKLWVNPDCGLKTRRWEEVEPALSQMVAAAQAVRASCRRAA